MLKPKINITETIGKKVIALKKAVDWTDFDDPSIVLGAKITCGALDKFEKFTVKIPIKKEDLLIEPNQEIEFENLQATLYISGNYINISWKADNVKRLKKSNNEFNFE